MRDGWLVGAPGDDVVLAPLSDGGPGFVDVLASALGGERVTLPVEDPLARTVQATYLRVGGTAYIESAQACGLHLLSVEERDPLHATTYGVGQLISHAVDAGATRVVVGLGGSATNDGGAGMLAALGVRRVDKAGERVAPGGLPLLDVDHLVVDLHPRLAEVELVAASDVVNPLLGFKGASAVYGPQKGASADETQRLDWALTHWADVLQRDLTGGVDVRALEGAGAAGGMGAALLSLGATRVSGIGLVRDALGLAELVASVALVVTGEGTYDWQSRDGKVISGVTALAIENGLPCVLIAGQVVVGAPADVVLGARRHVRARRRRRVGAGGDGPGGVLGPYGRCHRCPRVVGLRPGGCATIEDRNAAGSVRVGPVQTTERLDIAGAT